MNTHLDKLKNVNEKSDTYMINSDYIESVTEESYSKFINRCTYIHMHTIPDSLFFINNDITIYFIGFNSSSRWKWRNNVSNY